MTHAQEPALFYGGNCNTEKARRALVSISLESALMGHDLKTYQKVVDLLKKKHGCTISDCYKHPEYLSSILGTLSVNLRYQVIKSVQRALGDFSHEKSIAKFLDGLG